MIYCILSDIHSNYSALEAVFKDAEKNYNINEVICLGDIVGYGPFPNECVDFIKNKCSVICAGNHDFAALNIIDISEFNDYAKTAIQWTAEKLTDNNKDFISNLKPYSYYRGVELVHASLSDNISEYIINVWSAVSNFKLQKSFLCFNGHTHTPVVFYQLTEHKDARAYRFEDGPEYYVLEENKYIINAGSVGQPRDHDPRASYLIYDTEKNMILNRRVEYCIEDTQNAMRNAGLPFFLIERLKEGK